ncbi:aromatic amino acid transport family protein, partial [Escherichia coli]|uniref:aromatic amino acid transport family protein n=1 Tax=Escherichia coli TaxID=562 RepID=UPI0035E10F7C
MGNTSGVYAQPVFLHFLHPAFFFLFFPTAFLFCFGVSVLCSPLWAFIIPAVLSIKARKKFPNQMFTVWGGNLIP